jgi:hypothetical protein
MYFCGIVNHTHVHEVIMQLKVDFLNPGLEQIKNSIRDIDDSYNHEWDVIAELCQNAVDAIKKTDLEEGYINISINSIDKSIRITDNGIGISPDELPDLLKPFSTNKRGDFNSIGEKGVGLTFVMFSGDYFEIKSGNQDGSRKGLLKDAYLWKNSDSDEFLSLHIEDLKNNIQGTEVLVKGVRNTSFFELNFEQLKYVLRTKTALGSTLPIWGEERNVLVELEYIDTNGKKHRTNELPFQYLLPYELVQKGSKIDYDEFMDFASEPQRSDHEKRNKIRNKIIFKQGIYTHSNTREIKYAACFVPSRKTWEKLSLTLGVCDPKDVEDEEWKEKYGYTMVRNGIMTSVKGMPTGIAIDHPSTGFAGYWSNIFILFEDPYLNFDIGRKSIHGRQASILRDYAKSIFNDFLKIAKFVSGEAEIDFDWDRDELFEEIELLPDLDYPNIKLKKSPKDQEAGVAALFFECLGNGIITGISPLVSGYKNKYDLYVKWGRKKKVIEFKSKLRNIVKDFNDAVKMFNEMDCIVCWDISEDDKQELRTKLAVEVEDIVVNPLGPENTQIFPNSTHKLTLSGFTAPVYVIDLKKLLDTSMKT